MSNKIKQEKIALTQYLQPKLRFPEFQDLGYWASDNLGSLYRFITTNSLSRDKLNYKMGSVKNIHYGDIHKKFSALFDVEKEMVPFINDSENISKFKEDSFCTKGDIIFADASEDMDDVGKSIEIVNLNNEKVLAGLHTLFARQRVKKLIVGFGGYLFQSDIIRDQIKKQAQGTKVFGISAGRLATINICYPLEKEQQKIADCLSSIDELITSESKKLNALKTYKKGLMQQLFPAEGETLPKLRFPEFQIAAEWLENTIGSITPNVTAGATPSTMEPNYWAGQIRWMNSGELNLKRVYEVQGRITQLGLDNSSAKILPKKCVLIGLAGQGKTRGTVAMNFVELCTNQSIAAIHPNESVFSSDFLYHNLDSRYDELRRISAGDGGRGGLNLQIIKDLKIHFPKDKKEQQKIADVLSSIDELITAESKKIEVVKNHKKGLMQQLFPTMSEL